MAAEIRALAQLPAPAAAPMRFIAGREGCCTGRDSAWGSGRLPARGLPDAEYWILGDGPERQALQALAGDLGIANRVRFWGNVERQTAVSKLGECDVLGASSLHDSGGWVCLEAMAAGRPVICLDLGGHRFW